MTRDEKVMSEAADTIAEWRAKLGSLERRIVDLEQELEREQGLNEMAADNAREQFDEDRAEYEEKIEFLEADRLRLSNLIHPASGICTVYAGKCWECDKEMKRLDEQSHKQINEVADLKHRVAQTEKARDTFALQAEQLRYDRDQLEEKVERLNLEVSTLDQQRQVAAEIAAKLQSDLRTIVIANRQRESAVVALCDVLQSLLDEQVGGDVLPYESEVRKALEKVRKGAE